MTSTDPSDSPHVERAGDDQAEYSFSYGHGRMPFFMKIVWVGFLAFATWYIVTFLLEALSRDLA